MTRAALRLHCDAMNAEQPASAAPEQQGSLSSSVAAVRTNEDTLCTPPSTPPQNRVPAPENLTTTEAEQAATDDGAHVTPRTDANRHFRGETTPEDSVRDRQSARENQATDACSPADVDSQELSPAVAGTNAHRTWLHD